MSSPAQTPIPCLQFNQILEAALSKYKKKTGKNILSHPLAVELQRCSSVDAILAILQGQAEAFEQFRGGDRRLMEGIRISVDVLSKLSETLGEGVSLVFPPAKAIFCGIGILLDAAKDVSASHDALVELFGRIEGFFKRLKIYTAASPTTNFAEVLVNVVVEVLNVLSIATKEMEQSRAKTYIKKLLGWADIEDALKRLDNLIREEHQAATAEILWNQIQQDVRKWFSPSDPSTNYNIACTNSHKGTTTWFFDGSLFKNWEKTASLLWVHGKPGSGKSILCSAIIKHIMALRDAGQAHLAYFYFDFRDEHKQNLHNLLISLLIQLSAYSSVCCNRISHLYSKHGNGTQQPSDEALTNCLQEVLVLAADHPTYIIMDALDECPDISGMPTPREVVLNFVQVLVRLRLPNVHICVTSRPEINIKAVLEPLVTHAVSIHDETGQKEDITSYVCSVVYSDWRMRGWRDEDKKLVVEVLSKRADGMFRWVFCQLETLRHSIPQNLRQILKELPENLDETYERVLKGISEGNRKFACRLLHCLAVAIRPFTVEELAEILAFDLNMDPEGIPKFHADWRWKDQEYAVLSTCSSLISIVDNNGSRVVQFSHFSVKEYLTSNRVATSTRDVSQYHILPIPAHTIIARVCLGFLLHLDNPINDESVKSFPLAKYAAQNWVEHVKCEDVASRVKDGMQSLFDPDKPHFAAWVQIHDMDSPVFRVSPTKRPNRPNPLYYSALCGFQDLVEHLVITHPILVNAIGGGYDSPLLAALRGKHIRIAELLLEHGGDIDVRGKSGQTPLHKVALWSHNTAVDAVRFLLKHGADVNARRSGDLCTSLHLVANYGELRVTQMLLEHAADVHSQNNNGQTPLHLVSRLEMSLNECNRPSVVRLLIAHGADVSARDTTHMTPLHYASRCGRLEVAQVLLEHGANANDQGATRTPLHLLLESNNVHDVLILVELLLKFGADANVQDENNIMPLHLALRKKWFEIARKLLEHGANPNAKDDQGQIPLHLLLEPNRDGEEYANFIELLLNCGADANAPNENNLTPLHLASRIGRLSSARTLLEYGANTNTRDDQGQTPLQLLLKHGNKLDVGLALGRLLMSHGAQVNIQDRNHRTALYWALDHWVRPVAELLLEHGAKVDVKNDQDQTPLHLLLDGNRFQDMHSYAQLLLKHGADPNAPDKKCATPLHLASRIGHFDVAEILLDHGANPNAMNDQGQTPLDLLLESNNNTEDASDLVELLLMYATIVDAQDRNNETPLQLPSCEGVSEIAQTLRNDSADVSVGDNMDPSATTSLLAAQKGDEEIPQPMTPNSSQMRRNRFRFPSFGFRSGHRR